MTRSKGSKGKGKKTTGGLVGLAFRHGFTKGVLGGRRPWFIVFGIAAGVRLLRKIAGSETQVVYSEPLKPGETLVIAHGREPR